MFNRHAGGKQAGSLACFVRPAIQPFRRAVKPIYRDRGKCLLRRGAGMGGIRSRSGMYGDSRPWHCKMPAHLWRLPVRSASAGTSSSKTRVASTGSHDPMTISHKDKMCEAGHDTCLLGQPTRKCELVSLAIAPSFSPYEKCTGPDRCQLPHLAYPGSRGCRTTSSACTTGPSRAKSASRSLRSALLMPQVHPGSLHRCGNRT